MQCPQEHLKTIVYAKFGGQTKCIMGNSKIENGIQVFKCLAPEYLSSNFVNRNETRYSLRDSVNKLFVPFPRTNFMKNSFSCSGAVLWNSLPCNAREAKSLHQFKRLVNLPF